MNIVTRVSIHETDVDLYDALKQVFDESAGETHRWIELQTVAGVDVIFFSPRHGNGDDPTEVPA